MNTKKKYAIRKLAVGVASVSIGLFISNTPEVAQTLGSVGGGIIQAFDNGTETTSNETTKDWKPEGSVVAQGEDGVPWELYENGYLLFKPEPGKDTLTNPKRSENTEGPSWKGLYGEKEVKAIGFTDKVYLPEDSSYLFSNTHVSGSTLAEYLDASKIDTSKVKNMNNMFTNSRFTKLDLNSWNTSNVEDMSSLFFNAELTELKIDKWDTSKVKNMRQFLYQVFDLKELNIQDWNTSNVEDMTDMFTHSYALTKLDLNKWDVSKVKYMTTMFSGLINLEELKISNWNTSNVESMAAMFEENLKLKELDISNWNTSKVKDMTLMFTVMHNLEKLDLGKWDTSNVEKMEGMFVNTFKLRYLDITNFDTSKVNNLRNMFANSGLIRIKIGDKFAKTQLKDGLFDTLDFEYIGELLTLGQKYGNKWTRLDKTTPFYTVEEWNKVFRENPEKLAGIWVREKKFREDVRKIVDEEDKEVKESELGNYTEPNEEPDGVTVDKIPIYKVQKITTTYKGDESLDKGQQVVEKDGKEDGNRVVRVGTKATVDVEKLPSPVRYEKDTTREKGQDNITVKGKDGSKTTTTTYTVNDKTGEVVPNVGKPVVVDPTETVVKVAAKDKVEVEKLPSPVRYEKDNTREKGQDNITIKGKDGSKTTTTTYTVNDKTGEVVPNAGKPVVVVEPTETVVKVAAKDKIEVEKLPSPVRYEKDSSREKGQENITVKGKDGSRTTTTTYTVNGKTGEVVPNVGKPVVVEPTETVVKVATKDKVEVEKLPSPVRYEKDTTREKGQDNITIKGKDGSKTTTTTYTVNDKTGEVVPNVGKPVVVEPTETIVKVAAKDKVVVEKLPSPVRYEKDNSREKGQENITIKGKDGSKTTTTTYTVNDKTGEVVENVGKPVVVEPTETVVKVATKDKVVVEKLPSPVRYEKDNSREKGQENITIKGKDGSKTTTTTYTVNDKTGEVVENVGKPVVVEPTETVVKVATKDKVVVVNKKDGETIKITTSYEVNPKTGEIKEVKKEELLSKKGIPEVSEEAKEFKGGVNPTESIVREALPELKVALIKDGEGNILEIIKEDEEPKEIKGYKNTGKTEVDKDGYKVYVYEKEENKQDSTVDKKEETEKKENKDNNKEAISKKEELPKTSASMLSTVGLFSIFGLRKNRRKDKK